MKNLTSAFLFLLLHFVWGCDSKSQKASSSEDRAGNDSLGTAVADSISRSQIIFVAYKKEGFIFPNSELNVYSENLVRAQSIQIDSIEPVFVIGITTQKFLENPNDEFCTRSNFIKVYRADSKRQEKIFFGQWVYEIERIQKVSYPKAGDVLQLFEVSNLSMEVADSTRGYLELTGCAPVRMLLIKSADDSRPSFIKWMGSQDKIEKFPDGYVGLQNDDGGSDEIISVEAHEDTVIVNIKSTFQEGGETSKLKIIGNAGAYFALITDRKSFDEH